MPTAEESRVRSSASPQFAVMERQTVRPTAVLLAAVLAVGGLSLLAVGLRHRAGKHWADAVGGSSDNQGDDKDDPSQVDTIVLGDPGDAPEPARRRKGHPSSVHPTILIRLPSSGPQVGLIPESVAGHLLYDWLAAFNHADAAALGRVLPTDAPEGSVAAQMALRARTGGFNLLSAKEVEAGVLVFRLRDQTPAGTEALGTLQVGAKGNSAEIGSFSLRAVEPDGQNTAPASPAP